MPKYNIFSSKAYSKGTLRGIVIGLFVCYYYLLHWLAVNGNEEKYALLKEEVGNRAGVSAGNTALPLSLGPVYRVAVVSLDWDPSQEAHRGFHRAEKALQRLRASIDTDCYLVVHITDSTFDAIVRHDASGISSLSARLNAVNQTLKRVEKAVTSMGFAHVSFFPSTEVSPLLFTADGTAGGPSVGTHFSLKGINYFRSKPSGEQDGAAALVEVFPDSFSHPRLGLFTITAVANTTFGRLIQPIASRADRTDRYRRYGPIDDIHVVLSPATSYKGPHIDEATPADYRRAVLNPLCTVLPPTEGLPETSSDDGNGKVVVRVPKVPLADDEGPTTGFSSAALVIVDVVPSLQLAEIVRWEPARRGVVS